VAGLVLTLSLVTPALASHSRTSAPQGTHTTPSASDPYNGSAEAQQPAEAEACCAATTTPAATPAPAASDGKPSSAAGSSTPAPAATHTKGKHAAHHESKSSHKTPEVQAPPSGGASSAPTTQAAQPIAPPSAPAPAPAATVPAPASQAAAATGAGRGAKASRPPRLRARLRRRSQSSPRASTPAPRAPIFTGETTLAAAVASPSGAAAHADSDRRPAAHRPASSSQAGGLPIVRSVTRIIGVVPLVVRILIAALIALALLLATTSRFAAVRARRLARQRSQLLEDVGLLQAALLPPLPPRIGPVGTSAAYQPASGPAAGGDFYDVFALADGQIAVIVGDVSGHGRDALPQTTLVRFTLRAYLEAGLSPRASLATAAPVLERQLGGSFVTVVLATYNPRERELVVAAAGHPPPLVLGSEPAAPITTCCAPPIGAGQPTGTRQSTIAIPGGAVACFYTDGVVEARTSGRLFGARRLQKLFDELPAGASAASLLERVAQATDRRPDDMAACLIRIEGDAQAPQVRVEELELDQRDLERNRAARFLLAAGVHPAEVDHVISQLHSSVARHGRVVLELHLGEVEPEIVLRPQNVATLEPSIRASAGARGART